MPNSGIDPHEVGVCQCPTCREKDKGDDSAVQIARLQADLDKARAELVAPGTVVGRLARERDEARAELEHVKMELDEAGAPTHAPWDGTQTHGMVYSLAGRVSDIVTQARDHRNAANGSVAGAERLQIELGRRQVHGWPVPCPRTGDKEACDACWSSHADAVPYCTGDDYKRKLADLVAASEARKTEGEEAP